MDLDFRLSQWKRLKKRTASRINKDRLQLSAINIVVVELLEHLKTLEISYVTESSIALSPNTYEEYKRYLTVALMFKHPLIKDIVKTAIDVNAYDLNDSFNSDRYTFDISQTIYYKDDEGDNLYQVRLSLDNLKRSEVPVGILKDTCVVKNEVFNSLSISCPL